MMDLVGGGEWCRWGPRCQDPRIGSVRYLAFRDRQSEAAAWT